MGAAAVVILLRKEKELVAAFRGRGAVSPESAVTLDSLNVHQGVALYRLRSHAVLRPGRDGTWYLDEPSWESTGRLRRKVLLLAVLATALFLAFGAVTLK